MRFKKYNIKITFNMTTVMINDSVPAGIRLLEYIGKYPQAAYVVHTDNDASFDDEELISLEEFKANMEELALTRLGLNLTLFIG